jgi:hypothetical protein
MARYLEVFSVISSFGVWELNQINFHVVQIDGEFIFCPNPIKSSMLIHLGLKPGPLMHPTVENRTLYSKKINKYTKLKHDFSLNYV